jgi:hypothetical protein
MVPRYDNSGTMKRGVSSDAVTKKRYETKPAIVSLKMEADLLQAIDAEVLAQSNRLGRLTTRSDVMKALLSEALAARAKKRAK